MADLVYSATLNTTGVRREIDRMERRAREMEQRSARLRAAGLQMDERATPLWQRRQQSMRMAAEAQQRMARDARATAEAGARGGGLLSVGGLARTAGLIVGVTTAMRALRLATAQAEEAAKFGGPAASAVERYRAAVESSRGATVALGTVVLEARSAIVEAYGAVGERLLRGVGFGSMIDMQRHTEQVSRAAAAADERLRRERETRARMAAWRAAELSAGKDELAAALAQVEADRLASRNQIHERYTRFTPSGLSYLTDPAGFDAELAAAERLAAINRRNAEEEISRRQVALQAHADRRRYERAVMFERLALQTSLSDAEARGDALAQIRVQTAQRLLDLDLRRREVANDMTVSHAQRLYEAGLIMRQMANVELDGQRRITMAVQAANRARLKRQLDEMERRMRRADEVRRAMEDVEDRQRRRGLEAGVGGLRAGGADRLAEMVIGSRPTLEAERRQALEQTGLLRDIRDHIASIAVRAASPVVGVLGP